MRTGFTLILRGFFSLFVNVNLNCQHLAPSVLFMYIKAKPIFTKNMLSISYHITNIGEPLRKSLSVEPEMTILTDLKSVSISKQTNKQTSK